MEEECLFVPLFQKLVRSKAIMYFLPFLAAGLSLGSHAAGTTLTTKRIGCDGVDGCPPLTDQPLDQTTMNNFMHCLQWASTSYSCTYIGTFTQAATLSATADSLQITEPWLQQFQTSVPDQATIAVNMDVNNNSCNATKGYWKAAACQSLPSTVPISALGRLCAKYSGTNCGGAILTVETILASPLPAGGAPYLSVLGIFALCIFSYLL
eukprot:Protomagalhaensia_sp_Gyna_25__5454@NODE_716_length_2786_cov_26_555879_g558_i0_p2_GENE_NODE_716_length_2786_cov_26_555879_g558_i0NODE_716_length_2786_cov_26_555879_g558_i0_p2_ORF_typecomplete_len209_score21_10_NODE_716_length_2786_cov_26_555879_g558_i021082734